MENRILIFGCGVIGGFVVDLLTRVLDDVHITVACRNVSAATERVNLAIAVAMNLQRSPLVTCEYADLTDLGRTADLIKRSNPTIVINATSLQTFWIISTLPEHYFRALKQACIGPWLPNHLALARKLMTAIKSSGRTPIVINASFPDAVNPILATHDLAPTIGAGNIANTIPTIKRAVSLLCHSPVSSLDVRFVAHHYVGDRIASYGNTNGAPFHLSVFQKGVNISDNVSSSSIFSLFVSDLKRIRGVSGQVMAASSVVAVARAFLRSEETLLHAPGPLGEIGGYPVTVSSAGVAFALPNALSMTQAREINVGGQLFEGIESIDFDGTVTFAPAQMSVLREILGYDRRRMRFDEIDDCADELQRKYHEFAARTKREDTAQQYAIARA